jgi:hypothetical protein
MTAEATLIVNAAPAHLLRGLLPWENEADFDTLYQSYIQEYAPKGPTERSLVDQLVWLDWRRRRMHLGERALHMASLSRAISSQDNDTLSRRALSVEGRGRVGRSSGDCVKSDAEEDAAEAKDWERYLKAAERALSLLEEQRDYDAALAELPAETREWFEEMATEQEHRFSRDAMGLQLFLRVEVQPYFKSSLAGYEAGSSIRLQAWGESLDPVRSDKLLALDERLMRQFEKVLSMLLRLKDFRNSRRNR